MPNSLVIRNSTEPARISKADRAAQYVRMSTDHQRYSMQNQATVIAAYAVTHHLSIVRTYRDAGESGLRIQNRKGLSELIEDVQNGRADFGHILVYDVSRWGRFQDIDESAHYEFLCRSAGIKIVYCAEQFDNDGSLLSHIAKNLKRVMAAEFSRELSAKVHAGHCRLTSLGFRQGATPGFALRRELIDQAGHSRGWLEDGEYKYLNTDRVKLRPGSPDEVKLVAWIFREFVEGKKAEAEIARELNRAGVGYRGGRPWNRRAVHYLLTNENYVGNLVYNRLSRRLRQKAVNNPPQLWIRGEGAIEPMVERGLFSRAQKIMRERRVSLPEDLMLERLRATLQKRGKLSCRIINETVGLPCTATYLEHFGTMRNAYRLVGYTTKHDCNWIDSGQHWAEVIAKLAHQVDAAMSQAGRHVNPTEEADCLMIDGTTAISFRIARWWPGRLAHHAPRWAFHRRKYLACGWVVAIRLAETNKAVLDYLLLPTSALDQPMIRFVEKGRHRYKARRFARSDTLIRAIIGRIERAERASAKSAQPKGSSGSRRPKRKTGHGRH